MNVKILGIIVLLGMMVIFAIQNTQTVKIQFLFWGFETSSVLTILVSFLIGVLVGWLMKWIGSGKRETEEFLDGRL